MKIQVVKSQVMEYLEGIVEARYHVEQIKKELEIDLEEVQCLNCYYGGHASADGTMCECVDRHYGQCCQNGRYFFGNKPHTVCLYDIKYPWP